MKQQYGYLAVLNGRNFMNKWLLWFALVALVVGLVLSAIVNISVCMWGCPQTIEVYSTQASFFVLAGLIVWVGHQLFSKYP
jgi:type II secretory pathway component PulL